MIKVIVLALSLLLLAPIAQAGGAYDLHHDFNAKHTPQLSAPAKVKAGQSFVVKIHVGEKQHPSLVDHHVEWVQLYAGAMLLAHVQLTPTMTLPNLSLTVMLEESADLKVVEAPNHSAGWVSKTVHVEVVK